MALQVCAEDGCSVTKCGHRATCTHLGMEASCSCDIGFDGNPYRRCYPVEVGHKTIYTNIFCKYFLQIFSANIFYKYFLQIFSTNIFHKYFCCADAGAG